MALGLAFRQAAKIKIFEKSEKCARMQKAHTHAHEKTRARVSGIAYIHITTKSNRGSAAVHRPGAAAPLLKPRLK